MYYICHISVTFVHIDSSHNAKRKQLKNQIKTTTETATTIKLLKSKICRPKTERDKDKTTQNGG